MLVLLAGSVQAAPVRTVLADPAGDGAWAFLTDLAELWEHRFEPTDERLALRALSDGVSRLRALERGRGDFAVVDAGTAVEHLARFPRLTALAVLWPNLLHVLTRAGGIQELGVVPPGEVWVLDSAEFVFPVLRDAARRDRTGSAQLHRVPQRILFDALDSDSAPILVFAAPTPAQEVVVAQQRNPTLQLLPLADKLVDELKLAYPWLVTQKMGRGTYPAQRNNLELPAVHQVLVGHRDLPADTVLKVLDTVYRRTNAMALFNPLFGLTDGRLNAVFGKLMPFHEATARRFDFTPSIP